MLFLIKRVPAHPVSAVKEFFGDEKITCPQQCTSFHS